MGSKPNPRLEKIVNRICDRRNLDRYTKEAQKTDAFMAAKTPSDKTKVIIQSLYNRVKRELWYDGYTLDDVIKYDSLKRKFESSGRLRAVLSYHQRQTKASETSGARSSDTSLESIARSVFGKRNALWNQATSEGKEVHEKLLRFVLLVRQEFKSQGHSLRELFKEENKALLDRYFTSGRLGLALSIYQRLFLGEQPPEQKPQSDRDNVYRKEAVKLARDAASGEGLMTKIGAKGLTPDEARRRAKQVMFKEHPDRNPEGNKERYNVAAKLKLFIEQGVFKPYKEELERVRAAGNKPRRMGRT